MKIETLFTLSCMLTAILYAPGGRAATNTSPVISEPNKAEITVLYDAFGKPSAMTKDWGFLRSLSTVENASYLTPETTPTSSRIMLKPKA
jgi:hypothetical protein